VTVTHRHRFAGRLDLHGAAEALSFVCHCVAFRVGLLIADPSCFGSRCCSSTGHILSFEAVIANDRASAMVVAASEIFTSLDKAS
jgi:hypothetical protein